MNAPLAVTRAACTFAVKVALGADVPVNARALGGRRDPRARRAAWSTRAQPSAVVAGNVETSQRIADTVLLALAQAADVPAQGQGTMNNVVIGTLELDVLRDARRRPGRVQPARRPVRRPRRHVEHAEHADRGARARAAAAGRALRAAPTARAASGRHRGGDGLVREIRVLEPATLSLLTDRRRHAPLGLNGRRSRPAGAEPPERRRAAAEDDARARARRRRHGRDTGRRRVGEESSNESLGRPVDPPPRGSPAAHWPRAVRGRRPGREPAARRLRAVAVGARRDPLGRPGRGARRARCRSRSLRHRAPGPDRPVRGRDHPRLAYYAMAVDRARYAGEPVAVVAAESRYLAEDAAELVAVDYEPLDAVVTVEDALDPTKPVLHEQVGSNVVVDRTLRYGDPDGGVRPRRPRGHRDAALGALQLDADRDLRRRRRLRARVRAPDDVGELHGPDDAAARAGARAANARGAGCA